MWLANKLVTCSNSQSRMCQSVLFALTVISLTEKMQIKSLDFLWHLHLQLILIFYEIAASDERLCCSWCHNRFQLPRLKSLFLKIKQIKIK